tara:strand:+ start:484 stop:1956 length:1473 start_codon:yes stop_codon:yes gene_type:complete
MVNKITVSFFALSLFSSCAHKQVSEQAVEVTQATEVAKKANKATVIHQNESRLIGSSKIVDPNDHYRKTYYLYGAEHLNLENYYFDIPVVYNEPVKKWINYFVSRGRDWFERYSARAGRYAPMMGAILEDQGLPRDLIFLAMAESGFNSKAKSWARAVGPWQFMPFTGKRYDLHIDWYVDERYDPIKATVGASKYLKKLYDQFGSWELAAASYNAGEGKMGRAIKMYNTTNFWDITKGRYLKPETKNYVPKIMALAIIGKNLKSFGFEDIDFHEELDFDEIEVKGGMDLMAMSEALGVELEEIQRLNPEVMRWFTPPNVETYKLRIPAGMTATWNECCKEQEFKAVAFMEYKMRSSRSDLADVARKFKIKDVGVLEHINGFSAKKRLERGQVVYLPFKQGQNIRDNMYADLYERPRKSVVRRRKYNSRIKTALRRGTKISNPSRYYTVQKGDSLWSVSRRVGVPMDTIIASNYNLLRGRMIRAGDKLAIE